MEERTELLPHRKPLAPECPLSVWVQRLPLPLHRCSASQTLEAWPPSRSPWPGPAPHVSALSLLVLPSLAPAPASDSGPICKCSCPHGALGALWVSWDPGCALGQQPGEVRRVRGPRFLEAGSWR